MARVSIAPTVPPTVTSVLFRKVWRPFFTFVDRNLL